ncbi:hypothetical protein EYR15_06345 [Hansschlegelia quercus]|uniref:Uncharacterized protein n=1 Tax=Hansschlegelia quercus TaxID=2528245 RepID=A0A4V2JEA1_9HYPH|nr:hypothetical protein EYR15_06345 [Hansschlegelia quercus]
MLHTRLRYALFVPWQFLDQSGKSSANAQDALKRAEIGLAKRLKDRGEQGVIGGLTWPQLADQPPSSTYWSALDAWGILRRDGRNRVPNRGTVHTRLSASRPTMDDEGRPLIEVEALFVALPQPPKDWSADTPLSFNLRDDEREFLRERLSHIPAPEPLRHLSLLSQLARHEIDPPLSLWDKAIIKLAGPDAAPLRRARAVAALAAIGRGVYAALVEDRRELLDGRETPRLHRAQLGRLLREHGARAASELNSANLHLVEDDIGDLPPRLRTVLAQTLDWVHEGATDPTALVGAYEAAEGRKGLRSRLPDTASARTRRAEWDASDHPVGYPLHYRWGSVSGLLSDLRGPRP